jgi:hypothetical protein
LPPASELKREAKILRQIAPDDPHVTAVCDAFDAVTEMLDVGYILREGGDTAVKPVPLHETLRGLWKKEPPEKPSRSGIEDG